jgi:acetyl esterase
MSLHPAIVAWLELLKALPPANALPVEIVRAAGAERLKLLPPPPAVGAVVNRALPGPAGAIPVRLYAPFGIGPFPLTIHFHGGGFVLGNLESHDHVCRHLCLASGSVVMAVDYRLAPEHKFPAATEDALAATRWAAEHAAEIGIDPRRIALAGDSAGANLAAVTALRIRDEGGPQLRGQVLNCPLVDYDRSLPSYRENAEGYFLTLEMTKWFAGLYLRSPDDAGHPFAAPLRASSLGGLPPAYVLTAQYDPLRDEAEIYADKLTAAGVPVTRKRYGDMLHDFPCLLLGVVPEAAEELCAMGSWLKARFAAL